MDISSPSSSQGFIRPTARPNQLIDDSISGPESTLGAIGLYFDAGRPEEVEIDADAVILDIKFLLRDWLGGGEGIFLSTSESVWALGRAGVSISLENETKRDVDAVMGVHDVDSLTVKVEGELSRSGQSAVVEKE